MSRDRTHRGLRVLGAGVGALSVAALLSTSCSEESSEELARKTIGPEGGEISGKGISVQIPQGALAGEVEVVLRTHTKDLTVRDFDQIGATFAVEPADLELLLPATVTVSGGGEEAVNVLFNNDTDTVIWPGDTAYVDHFGLAARGSTGDDPFQIDEPALRTSPDNPGNTHTDSLHMEVQLADTHRLELRLKAYDYDKLYGPLNGDAFCGFEVTNLEGGTITKGCTGGELTSSLNVTSNWANFDITPFLAPKMPEPVPVSVIFSDGDIGFAMGYFAFGTGNCYQEQCSGHGVCEGEGDAAQCECEDGYARPDGEPFECECVPQCDSVQCGSDSCGGSCPPGCDDQTESCMDGVCIPNDPTTGGDGDGDGGDGDGDGMPGDGDGDGDGTPGDGDGDGDGGM